MPQVRFDSIAVYARQGSTRRTRSPERCGPYHRGGQAGSWILLLLHAAHYPEDDPAFSPGKLHSRVAGFRGFSAPKTWFPCPKVEVSEAQNMATLVRI
jgi:hypothetical protein